MISLSQAADDYLAMRRALGYKLIEHGRVLPQFAEFLGQRGESLITIELALEFAMQPAGASVVWWHQRLAIVRGFARYLQAFDARHEVPPVACLWGRFSHDEAAPPHSARAERRLACRLLWHPR